jgi:hypothetical protein
MPSGAFVQYMRQLGSVVAVDSELARLALLLVCHRAYKTRLSLLFSDSTLKYVVNACSRIFKQQD